MYDNCGELRDAICILAPERGQDSQGNATSKWTVLAQTMAQARDRSGREFYSGAQVQTEKVKDFKIRWREGLSEGMGVQYRGAVYEITDIDHLGNRRGGWMLLRTRLVKGEGAPHGEL